jgi:Zn-dependent protease
MSFRPTIYLGRWFGVEIRLDWYVVVFIGIMFLFSLDEASRSRVGTWGAVAHLVLLCVLLFCIFLHEAGHATMAKLRGHRPRLIMLSFVGFTFFEAKKARPIDETLIAIAGPATNAVIGILLLPFVIFTLADRGAAPLLSQASLATWKGFLATLSLLNFVVAIGNLMPLWPMDGARAVRGFFAGRLGFVEGTERAVKISHGLWLINAGVSVVLLTLRGWILPKDDPASSPFSMLLMYQFVVLLLAAMGIYYGWVEVRRVRALGAAAKDVAGPPPEFEPKRPAKPSMIDAEVVSGGRPESEKPQGPTMGEKVTAAKNAATALWTVAKLTGKGAGWFAKQGIKAAGEMMKDKDKKDA